MRRAVVGRRAEDLAVAHLRAAGYRIIERNFTCAVGELDIIAWDDASLCFVEVRGVSSLGHGDPLETIDAPKKRRVVAAARAYLESGKAPTPWPPMRFDAVGVILTEPPLIRLVREAFEA